MLQFLTILSKHRSNHYWNQLKRRYKNVNYRRPGRASAFVSEIGHGVVADLVKIFISISLITVEYLVEWFLCVIPRGIPKIWTRPLVSGRDW